MFKSLVTKNQKEQQQRAFEAICHGDDVFVSLPTGFGKSLCFHVLPFLFVGKLGRMDGLKKKDLLRPELRV